MDVKDIDVIEISDYGKSSFGKLKKNWKEIIENELDEDVFEEVFEFEIIEDVNFTWSERGGESFRIKK